MRNRILSAALLAALAAPGALRAQTLRFNDIAINASGPGNGITTLEITQDAQHPYNQVTADTTPGSTAQLPVAGKWNKISITQGSTAAKGANILAGSVATDTGSTAAALTAHYTTTGAGDNTHTLTLGAGSHGAPANPSMTVAVTNTGSLPNSITDRFDSGDATAAGSLTYGMTVAGTGNTIGNTIQASAAVSFAMQVSGDSNKITTSASGGTSTSIDHQIYSSGNILTTSLAGSGTQSSTVMIGTGSKVNYAQESLGANQSVSIALTDVVAAAGTPADVAVLQTPYATGGTVSVTYAGTGYTAGTLTNPGPLPSNYVSSNGGAGPSIYVYQNSSTPITINAAAAEAGYKLKVTAP